MTTNDIRHLVGSASQRQEPREDDMKVVIIANGCTERYVTRDFGNDLTKLRVSTAVMDAKKFSSASGVKAVKALNELYIQQGRYPEILAMGL